MTKRNGEKRTNGSISPRHGERGFNHGFYLNNRSVLIASTNPPPKSTTLFQSRFARNVGLIGPTVSGSVERATTNVENVTLRTLLDHDTNHHFDDCSFCFVVLRLFRSPAEFQNG